MLRIEHLDKSFRDRNVLRDLSLELRDGSVCGLVGANGAGKSTLLRLIAGVYQRDGGTIRFNDRDTWSEESVRRDIAFVADEADTPPGGTIRSKRVLYEAMYDFDGTFFDEGCREFELDVNKPLTQFSRGMKRRTALLFALALHPKLLLLDEVYDGLEPLARMRFKQMLAERMEEEGMSALIAGHSLRELEDICDTYGILKDGRITRYGDLIEDRSQLRKYQTAFDHEVSEELFREFDVLRFRREGRVVQLVIRGKEEEVTAKLETLKPVLIDVLPVTFEELFLLELEERGTEHE